MSRRRIAVAVGIVAAGLLVVAGVPLVSSTASAKPASHAVKTAVARPLARLLNRSVFAKPPTTSQCESAFGIACYQPGQLESAYDMGPLYAKGLTGTGETIALVDSFGSPTIKSDLAAFDKAFDLPAPPSFRIIAPAGAIPPYNPNNSTMVGWAEETSLDVEYSHAMAPGANILLVETPVAETVGIQGFPEIVQAENYVINRGLAQVISQSFAAAEQTFPGAQSLLNLRGAYFNAKTRGVTVLGAAGDDGTSSATNPAGTNYFTSPVVNWPASDPLVTAVGGTQLHLNDAGQRTMPDNVWNDTNLLGSPAAGGGGLSTIFGRPSWQKSLTSVVGNRRGLPDVSLSAAVDGGVLVQLGFPGIPKGLYIIGGTSEAAPLFSGIVAIADQVAGHPLGLINPALYSLAAAGAPGIVDITTGNNAVSFVQGDVQYTVPGYAATPGYDLASGLGTVDGASLVPELASWTPAT
jgi:subtilase family serine protease